MSVDPPLLYPDYRSTQTRAPKRPLLARPEDFHNLASPVYGALERTTEQTKDFQDFITRYAWGEIWARPGLDRRTRSCITLTALVALGRFDELAMHIRGARRNGLSEEEIREVLLHSAVYCGVPAANSAFAVVQRVLEEE